MSVTPIVATFTCLRCDRKFHSTAQNAKYCSLACQQQASRARRKLRQITGETGIAHFDAPAAAPTADPAKLDRLTKEIMARNEGKELTAEEAPSTSQRGVEEFFQSFKKPNA